MFSLRYQQKPRQRLKLGDPGGEGGMKMWDAYIPGSYSAGKKDKKKLFGERWKLFRGHEEEQQAN